MAELAQLLANPKELLKKKPFTRGSDSPTPIGPDGLSGAAQVGATVTAELPNFEREVISQSRYLAELDPASHDVLFDENIPSITAKLKDGSYVDIKFQKMAIPFQKAILKKKVLHLCGNDILFTLDNEKPSEDVVKDFATFKRYWKQRNQGGMRTKMVTAQLSCGDAGLLYYFDRHGCIKSRLLSYQDGYVICSHNDDNGDRLAEAVYYKSDDKEYIDVYTDLYQYRYVKSDGGEWKMDSTVNGKKHGFTEIPLVTKRGSVAWDDVETLIEVYEIIYNIFLVIQKRHGWGVLYIKGTFDQKAKKIAGNIILNDSSLNHDGDAKFLAPPSPQNMIETLKLMEESIQKGAGVTFILPKDISLSGDVSGVAVQIAQSLDNEEALSAAIEWQNVASKMARLFKYGLAKELVKKEKDKTAITRFVAMDISASFKIWRPRSDAEYNQMLVQLKGAGVLSQQTAIEKNTESTPDESLRVEKETREAEEKARADAALAADDSAAEDKNNPNDKL